MEAMVACIKSLLAGARDGVEVWREIRELVAKNKGSFSPDLVNSVSGERSSLSTANALFYSIINKKMNPFFLRVGNDFKLPLNPAVMNKAIVDELTWDWTFVFGHKGDREPSGNLKVLRKNFLDPNDEQNMIGGASTTSLMITSKVLPESFGEAVYVSGFILGDASYADFPAMNKDSFFPQAVVIQRDEDDWRVFSDSMTVNLLFRDLDDHICKSSSTMKGFIVDKELSGKDRRINDDVLKLLDVKIRRNN